MAPNHALRERDRFCFSLAQGKRSAFVADHLRVACISVGIQIKDDQRFRLHNLRHSLSNWLVNKAKVRPKTVESILRHSRIQPTLELYTQPDSEETRAAQGEY